MQEATFTWLLENPSQTSPPIHTFSSLRLKDWEITANDYMVAEKFDKMIAGFDVFGATDDSLAKKIDGYLISIGISSEEIECFRSIMLEDRPAR